MIDDDMTFMEAHRLANIPPYNILCRPASASQQWQHAGFQLLLLCLRHVNHPCRHCLVNEASVPVRVPVPDLPLHSVASASIL